MPNEFKPGEKFSYNQTNYLLLGRIIDKLSGMSFQEFIAKEQLEKAGMQKTIQSGFGATKYHCSSCSLVSYQYRKGPAQEYVLFVSAFFTNGCCRYEFNSKGTGGLDHCLTELAWQLL